MAEKVMLEFLARQPTRIQDDMGRMRDDMAVLLAIVQRMDATMAGFMNELRAMHGKQDRQARAIRAVEERLEQGGGA
jgi:nitrate reductase assembly molybdenum cofactor insertion protein NarJ